MGNNHGGLAEINGNYYIFWHRQTHGTSFSRQGSAERVEILPDGSIPQVQVTSCGLNDGPLREKGAYSAHIACHLTEKDRSRVDRVTFWMDEKDRVPVPEDWPYITEEDCEQGEHGLKPYIYNMKEGAAAGFKYFSFSGDEQTLEAQLRGEGKLVVRLDAPDGMAVGELDCQSEEWRTETTEIARTAGIHALYFETRSGNVDFAGWEIK